VCLAGRDRDREQSPAYPARHIQSGVDAKVVQTLAGHHSASFTLDQHADAVPEQLEEASEKVADVLLAASGSKTVAARQLVAAESAQVIELESAPGEIRTPDPQVRSLMLYPTELRARQADLTKNCADLAAACSAAARAATECRCEPKSSGA
jgi:hypothetical protein